MARGGFPGGFGGGNINNLMKQAQAMQKQMEEMQKEVEAAEFEASVGGGAISVRVNGKKEVLGINIKSKASKSFWPMKGSRWKKRWHLGIILMMWKC